MIFPRRSSMRALHRVEADRAAADHATLAPASTLAMRAAAPTPVITPQPIRQARSNGISSGTAIAPVSGTTEYCAWDEMTEKWCSRSPSQR